MVEPYSTLWFIYLLAVFSVVTKLLREVPRALLLLVAALIQIVPVATSSLLVEEFCDRYVWFVIGFLFAGQILAFAHIAQRHPVPALAGLALWAAIDGALALMPSGSASFPTLAALPVLRLALGGAGALAVVATASLLTRIGGPLTDALRLFGERSMVIYLAFFLPMAATRAVLVKTGILPDVGWVSLMVTVVAATTPLVLERLIRPTPFAFLFRRPRTFHIVRHSPTSSGSVLRAA